MKANLLSKLTTSTLVVLSKRSFFEVVKKSSIKEPILILQVDSEPSWIDPLVYFLKDGTLLLDLKEARKLKNQASRYILHKRKLYRMSYSLPLLKCLCPSEADYALREVHKGICGNYLGRKSLAYKILLQGYYWSMMQQNVASFAKCYDRC